MVHAEWNEHLDSNDYRDKQQLENAYRNKSLLDPGNTNPKKLHFWAKKGENLGEIYPKWAKLGSMNPDLVSFRQQIAKN